MARQVADCMKTCRGPAGCKNIGADRYTPSLHASHQPLKYLRKPALRSTVVGHSPTARHIIAKPQIRT